MITSFDFAVLDALQSVRGGFLDWIMIIITYMGSTGLVWIVPGLALMCRRSTRRQGAVILAAMALGHLLGTLVLKNIVMRPRPFSYPRGLLSPETLAIPLPMGRWSFPSGHAITSFAAATGIFFANRKCGTAALALAALIGFSRLYLYVHFPTDVLVGAVLGVLCGIAAQRLSLRIAEKLSAVNNK